MAGKNPVKEVTILHAVRWTCMAWEMVTPSTIANCWRKSTLLGVAFGPEKKPAGWVEAVEQKEEETVLQVEELLDELEKQKVIKARMEILQFINPSDEMPQDITRDELLDHVVEMFTPAAEEEDELDQPPEISIDEAIEALKKLRLYEEAHEDFDRQSLTQYNRAERVLLRRKREIRASQTIQSRLHSYFKRAPAATAIETPETS